MDMDRQWICEVCGTYFDGEVNDCSTCSEKGVKPKLRLIHRLISAEAVAAAIIDELHRIDVERIPGSQSGKYEYASMCLGRVGAAIDKLKFEGR